MTRARTHLGTVASAMAGAGVGALAWVAIVPWDLSTHANGRAIPGGPSESLHVRLLFIALALPYVVAIAGAVQHLIRPIAFSVCSGLVWTALTTWRGMAAEVSGANMAALWPFVGIPATMIGSALVVVATEAIEWVRRRSSATS